MRLDAGGRHAEGITLPEGRADEGVWGAMKRRQESTALFLWTGKDGVIEIQGDQRDRLAAVLECMGYQVKRVRG
jgi:hypothetical protein